MIFHTLSFLFNNMWLLFHQFKCVFVNIYSLTLIVVASYFGVMTVLSSFAVDTVLLGLIGILICLPAVVNVTRPVLFVTNDSLLSLWHNLWHGWGQVSLCFAILRLLGCETDVGCLLLETAGWKIHRAFHWYKIIISSCRHVIRLWSFVVLCVRSVSMFIC